MSKAEKYPAPLPKDVIKKKFVKTCDGRKKKKKRNERRHEIMAKKKELRQIKKAEKLKQDKKEVWVRLAELNNNFAKMKDQKKLN